MLFSDEVQSSVEVLDNNKLNKTYTCLSNCGSFVSNSLKQYLEDFILFLPVFYMNLGSIL